MGFFPAATNQDKLKDKVNLSNSLFKLLEKDIPSYYFVLSVKPKITKSSSMEPQTSPVNPRGTMKQLNDKFTYNESNTLQQNVVEFSISLNASKNQIEHQKNLT